MNEITLSAIIFACAAAFVGIVFLVKTAKDGRKREALRQYCEKNGFRLRFWDKGNEKGLSVRSEDWILSVSMRAAVNNAETGSSGWAKETEWLCERPDDRRLAFALYCSKAQCGFEAMPEWVRSAAIEKMRRAFPGAADFSSVRTAFCEKGITCLAFENAEKTAQPIIERLRPAVGRWNGGVPVCIECSPERVKIVVRDSFLEEPEQVDALVRMGEILTGRHG